MNETTFTSPAQARATLPARKDDLNFARPHSGLRNLPPALYAQDFAIKRGGTLLLRTSQNVHYLAQGSPNNWREERVQIKIAKRN